jgi:prepilin-type N-terminal cleavage/methylation domain-containing protein
MPRKGYPPDLTSGKLGVMSAGHSRGFTLVELLITVAILGVVGVAGLFFAARWSSPIFDSDNAAKAWAQGLQYSFVASDCMNTPAAGGYVRCTVRVLEQKEPIPLECGIVSKKCSIMKASNQ